MKAPFEMQIICYLFLAGVSAGSALFAGALLTSSEEKSYASGKRALTLSVTAILIGIVFLIADLANPQEFLLILTNANPLSAIAWGARIVVAFSLVAVYCWIAFRRPVSPVGGGDKVALLILRVLALALAIYPGFVLMQGEGVNLWHNWIIVPLVALSGLHAGLAAASLLTERLLGESGIEGISSLAIGLLILALILTSGSVTVWSILALVLSAVLPWLFRKQFVLAGVCMLAGALAIRVWLINDGQALFF